MTKQFRPLLAEAVPKEFLPKIDYPVLASAKIDGLRCLVRGFELKTRTLKAIPNNHTRAVFDDPRLEGFDGELVVGDPFSPTVFNDSQSGLMTKDGKPNVTYYVFDLHNEDLPYNERLSLLEERFKTLDDLPVVFLDQRLIHSHEELEAFEEEVLGVGYEGVILRSPQAPYKYGRSTLNQQWMLKLKRFEDSEAEIIGFVEGKTNNNQAVTDERGHTKRSTHKENMVPSGTLGALMVRDIHYGWEFEIGTGFPAKEAQEIWDDQKSKMGGIVKYQFFKVGMIDKPRFPSYKGFRHKADIGEPV